MHCALFSVVIIQMFFLVGLLQCCDIREVVMPLIKNVVSVALQIRQIVPINCLESSCLPEY